MAQGLATEARMQVDFHLDFARLSGQDVELYALTLEVAAGPLASNRVREVATRVFADQVAAYEVRTGTQTEFAEMRPVLPLAELGCLTHRPPLKGFEVQGATAELVRRAQRTVSYRKQAQAAEARLHHFATEARTFLDTLSGVPPAGMAPTLWKHLLTHWRRRFSLAELVSKSDFAGLRRYLADIGFVHGLPSDEEIALCVRRRDVLMRAALRRAPRLPGTKPGQDRRHPDRFELFFCDPEIVRQLALLNLWFAAGEARLRRRCMQAQAAGVARQHLGVLC